MNNFNNKKWDKQPANAPEGMYDQVRQRIIHERIRMAQNRRQLVVGSALLLIVGAFNIGIILLKTEKSPVTKDNTEQLLYETYFDNAITLSNEK
jgi:hypothetical protein